uniref:Ig-like domain-containing protein n=1 Tax=Astatotilapia calliptera TaxID=8154 RepID=A0A3P8NK32_ASTCA
DYKSPLFSLLFSSTGECDLYYTGKAQRTSNYAVSQLLIESNPGDTMTLQCSVFSDSDNKTCPGDLNILWVREGSDKSLPNIIYTDRNRSNECEKRSDHQKTCVYRFSKNVSSSDAGTYYCAVATCGEILFGSGTTVVIQGNVIITLLIRKNVTNGTLAFISSFPFLFNMIADSSVWSQTASRVVFLLCAVVVISLIVIAVLIYTIKINNSDHPKGCIPNKHIPIKIKTNRHL